MSAVACERYCVLRCGSLWFAVPAASVREVLTDVPLVALPHADDAFAGLCHVRSEFLPVLRLASLVGGALGQRSAASHLLVMIGTSAPWALLVDQVVGLEPLESVMGATQPVDDWGAAMLGTATCGDQVVRILDPVAVYRLGERLLKAGWENGFKRGSKRSIDRGIPVGISYGEAAR